MAFYQGPPGQKQKLYAGSFWKTAPEELRFSEISLYLQAASFYLIDVQLD